MGKITKIAIGIVSVGLIIGVVSLFHPLPIVWGWIGFIFLCVGAATGLTGATIRVAAKMKEEQNNGETKV